MSTLRPKMSREMRAKQFMPFAALKGYEDALRAKEHIVVPRAELSEERLNELDEVFSELSVGCMVECIYYSAGEENYIKKTGILTRIDKDSGLIKIVNTSIGIKDIYDLKKI